MNQFIKGMTLCRDFFNDCAKKVIEYRFPDLKYSAGLIGYGSDVLGYDDAVSTDHMWETRFYLFLSSTLLTLNLYSWIKVLKLNSRIIRCELPVNTLLRGVSRSLQANNGVIPFVKHISSNCDFRLERGKWL